jgi:hypothetical protein
MLYRGGYSSTQVHNALLQGPNEFAAKFNFRRENKSVVT